MLFSIILPTYNRAHLIGRAIDSVRNQEYENWELLVSDDGSSDNTKKIVDSFTERDERITYINQSNQGPAVARNHGAEFAKGSFLSFLDSDDEYLPDHLSVREQLISQIPAVELIHGNVEVIGSNMVADMHDPSKLIPIDECIIGGTFTIRRDLFKRLGGFSDMLYGDDNDFFTRAMQLGALIKKNEKVTYRYYRTESDSITMMMQNTHSK
ncbi:MAG: glycosyltransferase family A protein [bacterium]